MCNSLPGAPTLLHPSWLARARHPAASGMPAVQETNPVSRAGSIVLDRARIKRERLTNWPAFAARYLRPPVHPG